MTRQERDYLKKAKTAYDLWFGSDPNKRSPKSQPKIQDHIVTKDINKQEIICPQKKD